MLTVLIGIMIIISLWRFANRIYASSDSNASKTISRLIVIIIVSPLILLQFILNIFQKRGE